MRVLDVLIASPGDATKGRDAVDDAIDHWNAHRSDREQIVLRVQRWETGSVALIGRGDAQSVINSQLVDKSDIVIALFYHKLGSATERAISGTAEEINRSVDAGKLVHVYFYGGPRPNDVDVKQLKAMNKFRKALFNQGLIGSFADEAQLRGFVSAALEHDIHELTRENGDSAIGPPPSPDEAFDVEPNVERAGAAQPLLRILGRWPLSRRQYRLIQISIIILLAALGIVWLVATVYTSVSADPTRNQATTNGPPSIGLPTTHVTAFPDTARHADPLILKSNGIAADLDAPAGDTSWSVQPNGYSDVYYAGDVGELRPQAGALFGYAESGGDSFTSCLGRAYHDQPIDLRNIPAGKVVCVRTSEGRFARMKLDRSVTPSEASFNVTVWES